MHESILQDGTRIWIDWAADIDESGLSGLSHIYRLADLMRFYGVEVDFDWLMGISGEAFAHYYHPDGTFLTPFTHAWDSALTGLRAYGFYGEWMTSGRGTGVESSLRTIEHEIKAGRPVIAPGIKASKDSIHSRCHYWFIMNGVDVLEKQASLVGSPDCSVNFVPLPEGDSNDPREHPRWHGIVRTGNKHYGDNPLLLVKQGTLARKKRESVLQSLEIMTKTSQQPIVLKGYGEGTYLAGVQALERLLLDVQRTQGEGLEEFRRLNPTKDDPFGGVHEELVHLRLLAERRRAAAAFLRKATMHLPGKTQPDMDAAAAKYDEVSQLALEAFELRHGPIEENDRIIEMSRVENSGDDTPEWVAYWKRADENLANAALRRDLANLIRRALEAECEAIAEIEKVLARLP